ncbi:hypothetical protein RJ640_000685 [Escallonia rubra]|uniref:Uncharacterized protein n=1 Tax=Escallonia rubra TaxID=112253 RepID=A0AA88UE05_9ASTE|nr:hypothetical protein RJ640_000685 [Escallonia rubra]
MISEYLREIHSIVDELSTAGSPISNEELVVKILRGLGPEFHEISTTIRACDTPISYKELFDKLLDHELFLKHEELKKHPALSLHKWHNRLVQTTPAIAQTNDGILNILNGKIATGLHNSSPIIPSPPGVHTFQIISNHEFNANSVRSMDMFLVFVAHAPTTMLKQRLSLPPEQLHIRQNHGY